MTTTERKGLGHLEWQSFPLAPKALKQPLSDMCRDQVRASLENPERHVHILMQSICMVAYFIVSPRRQQAVTYLLLDPKAAVFITGMKCVVFLATAI